MVVKIKKTDLDFLILLLEENSPELAEMMKDVVKDLKITFEIDSEHSDQIRDLVEEEIQKSGFDEKYNLNEKGKILQELSERLCS